ncbi:MAG: quinone-dependent dihydroorotate dehydrogenase [Rikenellaceae bacterium]
MIKERILSWVGVERVHNLAIWWLRILVRIPFAKGVMRSMYRVDHPSLEREVLGLHFANPIGMAAGFDRSGEVLTGLESVGFGFVEVGSITPEPQVGNPKPRLFRLAKDRAIINRMGHPSRGWVYAINKLRRRSSSVVVGCNIARNNNTPHSGAGRELLKSFRNLYQYVDYFTVNISYKHLFNEIEVTPQEALTEVLTPLFDFRRGQSDYRPIMLKVVADLGDDILDAVSDVLISTPLDGIVAVSGTNLREGLSSSSEQLEKIGRGRLSGAPIRERALEVVRHIHRRTDGAYPIIGVGGISTADDAQAMIDAGASLVQIYSSFIYGGLSTVGKMCQGLIVEEKQEADMQGGEFTDTSI